MVDVFTWFALLGLAVVLLWVVWRIEPHKAAPDGRWFSCEVQSLEEDGRSVTRWRRMRAQVVGRRLAMDRTLVGGEGPAGASLEILAPSPSPPRGRAVYLARAGRQLVAVKVPASSPAVAVLDDLAAR